MEKLAYGTNINGTDESGIIDISTNPPTLFCLCAKETADKILKSFKKSKSYDELENKIVAFYPEDESEAPGDLCDLGETVAMHFGYLGE